MTTGAAIVVLGPGGLDTARRAAAALPGARIHGLTRRVDGADVGFAHVAGHLRQLYADGVPIVGVCAAAILIRALAPELSRKGDEPPVIAIAEDASAVVPLLGGHRGANAMAATLADLFGVAPAVTTAGDLRFNAALDSPPPGWILANPEDYRTFAADLLAGARLRLTGKAPWLTESDLPFAEDGRLAITVTHAPAAGSVRELVYYPAVLAVGVGCERGVDPDELVALVANTLAGANLAPEAVAGVFSLDLKSDEAAVHAVSDALGVPARFFDAETLEAETPRLANPSSLVYLEVGCHGVAEGAALAAAGPKGELRVAKTKSARATCAVALAPVPIDIASAGRARGWLGIVGAGPGQAEWLTPEAGAMLARATDVVGYSLYLDLVAEIIGGKERHDYVLGEEERRVRAALDLAASGRAVALVSSGDPGVYAMASLVFELIAREDHAAWRRIDLAVAPGITALQAAAARVGAPVGHDFCAISLSDLLTPWKTIEKRLAASAIGDFVVALYNPVSHRRDWQLTRARDILLQHRPEGTPVVVARNLGRDGERVRVIALRELAPENVDMLTVVLVGSTATRAIPRADGRVWVYTPRGYDGAVQDQPEAEEEG